MIRCGSCVGLVLPGIGLCLSLFWGDVDSYRAGAEEVEVC